MTETAVRLVVTGRVQGVFFRDWAVREARALGVHGWVRNRRDGAVEIALRGPEPAIERFVTHCGHGPTCAAVAHLERESVAAETIDGDGFSRRPTV